MEELDKVIACLKPGKAIGLDNIATEQIKDPRGKATIYSYYTTTA